MKKEHKWIFLTQSVLFQVYIVWQHREGTLSVGLAEWGSGLESDIFEPNLDGPLKDYLAGKSQ